VCTAIRATSTCSRNVWNIDMELVRARFQGSTIFHTHDHKPALCSIAERGPSVYMSQQPVSVPAAPPRYTPCAARSRQCLVAHGRRSRRTSRAAWKPAWRPSHGASRSSRPPLDDRVRRQQRLYAAAPPRQPPSPPAGTAGVTSWADEVTPAVPPAAAQEHTIGAPMMGAA
jgi:hypothetical protein